MPSIAESLREETAAYVRSLGPSRRVDLALSLGDDDVELFGRARGLDRETAARLLRERRQVGRLPCSFLREARG